jgi:hypothetical protein
MKQTRSRKLLSLLGLLLLNLGLSAQTLQIIDTEGHSTTVTGAQLAKAQRVTVNVRDHDTPAKFEGVPLAAVLASAGIALGDKLRGPRLAEALLAEARDGYGVVFALAELDSAFATREIILADARDGKPLDAKEGPFRIVVPGDKRAARWIRQVSSIKIVAVK